VISWNDVKTSKIMTSFANSLARASHVQRECPRVLMLALMSLWIDNGKTRPMTFWEYSQRVLAPMWNGPDCRLVSLYFFYSVSAAFLVLVACVIILILTPMTTTSLQYGPLLGCGRMLLNRDNCIWSELQVDGAVIKHQLCAVCVCADAAGGVDILCNALHTQPGGLSRLSRCQPADILYCHSFDAWHRC